MNARCTLTTLAVAAMEFVDAVDNCIAHEVPADRCDADAALDDSAPVGEYAEALRRYSVAREALCALARTAVGS